MRPSALKTILRLRKLDRDAAQRGFADAIALEDAATQLRVRAERTVADELSCAIQADEGSASRLALVDWLPTGRVEVENQRQFEARASESVYNSREHLIGHQVGLAAVETIAAARRSSLQERFRKAEIAMLQEASLRRI